MITITGFTHMCPNGIVFEESDISITNITNDDYLYNHEWDLLEEALMNLFTDKLKPKLKPNEWYKFTFKRVYDDDGSGARTDLWFEFIRKRIIKSER